MNLFHLVPQNTQQKCLEYLTKLSVNQITRLKILSPVSATRSILTQCSYLHGNKLKRVTIPHINPDKNLDWSKLKEIADNILKCIKNEKYLPHRVENIVRKGEIACYKQFLLLSQCFQQLYIFSASKCCIVR